MKLTAGANIELVKGHRKVMAEMSAMMNHFLFSGKLRGFEGSSCDSHPTRLFSRSMRGKISGARCCFFVLFRERCFSNSLPMSL